MSLEAKANDPFAEKVQSKIGCAAKILLCFAGDSLTCEVCRYREECVIYGRLEDAQKEIQFLDRQRKTVANLANTKIKVLEGCLTRIRSLIKEFPVSDEIQFSYRTTGHIKEWFARLEKELKEI